MIVLLIKNIIAFFYLLTGSVSDIKTREVADWSNYGLIAMGFASNAIFSIAFHDIRYVLYSVLGFLVLWLLALLMYYSAQWGGGDGYAFMTSFIVNLLLAGSVYGIAWSLFAAFRNREKFLKTFIGLCKQKEPIAIMKIVLAAIAVSIVLYFFLDPYLRIVILSFSILAAGIFYLWLAIKAIEESCMYKKISISELTEGDWIAENIRRKGKQICGPGDLGISKNQIFALKKLNVGKIKVKEGIPFVPSFLAGWLMTVFYGNFIMLLI